MTRWHHIFCRSDHALPNEELAEYITDSWYGDGVPDIVSAPHRRSGHHLIVELPGGPTQRIDLFLDSTPDVVAELVNEFLGEHGAHIPRAVTDVLNSSRQAVSIELRPELLTEDAWELLDQTQAFIATRLDGVLAIFGDGIYDRNLQCHVQLTDR